MQLNETTAQAVTVECLLICLEVEEKSYNSITDTNKLHLYMYMLTLTYCFTRPHEDSETQQTDNKGFLNTS